MVAAAPLLDNQLAASPARPAARPASARVQQKVAARRQQIFAAAAELFSARGYRAVSMKDLAGALGVGKASLYHYVRSKEELLTLLYAEVIAENTAMVQASVARGGESGAAILREVLVQRAEYTAARQPLLRIFYEEELELPGPLSSDLHRERRAYEDALVALVERGVQDGSLYLRASPRLSVNVLLGGVNWTYRWYKAGGALSPRQFGEQVADTLLAGLTAPTRDQPAASQRNLKEK